MGNVAFFPIKFIQKPEKLIALEKLQAQIKYTNQCIDTQEKDNPFMKMVRKQKLANSLRAQMHVIKEQ
jgi:hypothetical protein